MKVNKTQLKPILKKHVTKRNILVFLLVFIVVGWFTNCPIIKWPYYRTKRVINSVASMAFPIIYMRQNGYAAGGSDIPPEDRDVPGIITRAQFDGKVLQDFYQDKFLNTFKGKDIFKTEYCCKGTLGFSVHKAYDDDGKYGEPKNTRFSRCYIFMRVAIGDRIHYKNGIPGSYPPEKAYIQLREGKQYYEQEISDDDYREVFQKVIDDKLFELDMPALTSTTLAQYSQLCDPVESDWTGLYIFGDHFSSIYGSNEQKVMAFKTWLLNRFPDVKNYPVTEVSTHDM